MIKIRNNQMKYYCSIILLFVIVACQNKGTSDDEYKITGTQNRTGDDPYLTERYWNINNTPMQQRLRNLKPFPVGVVYYQQRGDNLSSAINEFKMIDSLGFTALKQVQLVAPDNPDGFEEDVFHAALNENIIPWYYGRGGWRNIDQHLVDSLNIVLEVNTENMSAIQSHPTMISFQNAFLHDRIEKMKNKPEKPKGMGEPGRNNPWMPERLIPLFAEWLESNYKTLENLEDAWNCGFTGSCNFTSFLDAAVEMQGTGFDQFGNGVGKRSKDFRRFRDAMKFQSELIVNNYAETMELFTEWDPDEPERTGGHQIFENQAVNTWDLEGQAKAAAIGGSFYSSIHLAHHFFLVDGESIKPVYMQARIVADMFKGGWAATWESTGGPTFHSGYFPYTVDERKMTQLMLSYIASGLKGIGFWMWNSRGEGWEVGEYALTNVKGKPTKRARIAGHVSSVLQEQRFELWEALDEPTVGVLYSWENEAMLGRLSLGQYPLNTPVYKTDWDKQFRQYHSQAKIGISRALMNNNIPFEYVTERDLALGLAHRYPIIYLPYIIALDEQTIGVLQNYANQGGRVVADMPLLVMDTYGRLNKQLKDTFFEKLFGFQTADHFNTFNNRTKRINNQKVEGYFGEVEITSGNVVAGFDDGTPAIISNSFGNGSTTVFNFEAGRLVFEPGNDFMEKLITYYTLDTIRPSFEVSEAENVSVFRRAAPKADHYILINEGIEKKVTISSDVINYERVTDLISNEEIPVSGNSISIMAPELSGIWLRCEKE